MAAVAANLETSRRTAFRCPSCRGPIDRRDNGHHCVDCGRDFPDSAGLPDLRIASDCYLDLEDERAKASRLASSEGDTDALGLAGVYYDMTDDVDARRRARFLAHIATAEARGAALASLLPATGRVLEIGCGTGGLLVAAASSGIEIVGADVATRWMVVARRRLADRGLRVPLIGARAEELPWPDSSFDVVVADSVVEHLADPALAFRECLRVVRPGGRLLMWSPNRLSIGVDPHVGLWGLGFLPATCRPLYVQARRGVPWTVRPLTAREAARLAERAGWQAVEAGPARLPTSLGRTAMQRRLIALHGELGRIPILRGLLGSLGPLWQLEAIRGETA